MTECDSLLASIGLSRRIARRDSGGAGSLRRDPLPEPANALITAASALLLDGGGGCHTRWHLGGGRGEEADCTRHRCDDLQAAPSSSHTSGRSDPSLLSSHVERDRVLEHVQPRVGSRDRHTVGAIEHKSNTNMLLRSAISAFCSCHLSTASQRPGQRLGGRAARVTGLSRGEQAHRGTSPASVRRLQTFSRCFWRGTEAARRVKHQSNARRQRTLEVAR
jgi:hypothetical protein